MREVAVNAVGERHGRGRKTSARPGAHYAADADVHSKSRFGDGTGLQRSGRSEMVLFGKLHPIPIASCQQPAGIPGRRGIFFLSFIRKLDEEWILWSRLNQRAAAGSHA